MNQIPYSLKKTKDYLAAMKLVLAYDPSYAEIAENSNVQNSGLYSQLLVDMPKFAEILGKEYHSMARKLRLSTQEKINHISFAFDESIGMLNGLTADERNILVWTSNMEGKKSVDEVVERVGIMAQTLPKNSPLNGWANRYIKNQSKQAPQTRLRF